MSEAKKALERLGFVHGQNRNEVIAHGCHWFLSGLGYLGSGDIDVPDLQDVKTKLVSGEIFIVIDQNVLYVGDDKRNEDLVFPKRLACVLYAVDRNHIYKYIANMPKEGCPIKIGTVTECDALGISEERMLTML